VDAALQGQARAVQRLRAKTGVIASEAEAVMQCVACFLHCFCNASRDFPRDVTCRYKQQAREKRKAALLGLRKSMAEVKDSIQGANARRAEQAAAEAARRAEEAKKIMAAAGNPCVETYLNPFCFCF
jgi:hypothetical protein